MFEKYADVISGGTLLLIAIAMYAVTPGPGEAVLADVDMALAPRLVALLLGGLSLMLFLRGIVASRRFTPKAEGGKPLFKYPGKLALTGLLILFAAVAFDPLGFRLTAMVYLFAQGYVLSYEKGDFKPVRMALIACVTPFIIYYLFGTWLSMPLPEGLF